MSGQMLLPAFVTLEDLAHGAVQHAHRRLLILADELARVIGEPRRDMLKRYVDETRTLLLRLLVVVRWVKAQHEYWVRCTEDWQRFEHQRGELRRAADELYHLHHAAPMLGKVGLWKWRLPRYDVGTALDVVLRGTYSQLPRCIDLDPDPPVAGEGAVALRWLRGMLRLRRCTWELPEGMEVRDGCGCVLATVAGEYELALSANPPADGPWKVLRLRLLIDRRGDVGAGNPAAGLGPGPRGGGGRVWRRVQQQVQQLLDDLPEQPMGVVHEEVHAACTDGHPHSQ